MKRIINNILIIALLLAVTSCNNDFLNENLEETITPASESTIYISPEWEARNYTIHLPGTENNEYEIVETPSWLHINDRTETFIYSTAIINCFASTESDFYKPGLYFDKIKISVNNQIYHIPVVYISEGDPTILLEKEITIDDHEYHFYISNRSNGLLMWDIVSSPDWLDFHFTTGYLSESAPKIVPPRDSDLFVSYINSKEDLYDGMEGTIVLNTNDKKSPTVEIKVKLDLGEPTIKLRWVYDELINFGESKEEMFFSIYNERNGIIVYRFEELPDWLTITPAKGACYTYREEFITLTCDRTKMEPGQNTATIYLKSNAINKPSIPLTVKAFAEN